MILTNTQENTPVLSNVGEVGEFRIRNSAKAFSILSSGLYANKIRAIIRELSCNAYDSHVAAGCAERPFEVHLPTSLEPWFSVRDYGVGLSHQQVVNIYTTYFESTKTGSNDFVGALGLGSKSPFSYTENFGVTAVQNGHMGVYTAFINEQGVPSIALMTESATDEPNGVEVKFSVNDRADFEKFRNEAAAVYGWFVYPPTVTGASVSIQRPQYDRENIIPGVHVTNVTKGDHYGSSSYAVMGNIAYPIAVPNAQANLGTLAGLLNFGLVMYFDIGELDFQASREGLSYIPQTIDAIRRRLAAVNGVLTQVLTEDANAVPAGWQRAYFLRQRVSSNRLWEAPAEQYAANTNFSLYGRNAKYPRLTVGELKEKYNIVLRAFRKSWNRGSGLSGRNAERDWNSPADSPASYYWTFGVDAESQFVVNDIKTGALTRAKFHWRDTNGSAMVFVIEPADRTRPMLTDNFFQAIQQPPATQIHKASELRAPERQERRQARKDATILRLERRNQGQWNRRASDNDLVWREADQLSAFDGQKTHYYVALNGFEVISKHPISDVKGLLEDINDSDLFGTIITLYGVRKADLAQVEKLANWRPLDQAVLDRLTNVPENVMLGCVRSEAQGLEEVLNQVSRLTAQLAADHPLMAIYNAYGKANPINPTAMGRVLQQFKCQHVADTIKQKAREVEDVIGQYPLLGSLMKPRAEAVVEYVNLIDNRKVTK